MRCDTVTLKASAWQGMAEAGAEMFIEIWCDKPATAAHIVHPHRDKRRPRAKLSWRELLIPMTEATAMDMAKEGDGPTCTLYGIARCIVLQNSWDWVESGRGAYRIGWGEVTQTGTYRGGMAISR